mgnify:FL=1
MPDPYESSPISLYTQSFGTNQLGFSTSGSTSANTTANWRIHVQNVEIMYKRVQTFSPTTGGADFNYLDCNVSIGATNEHKYWNASAGDMMQLQTLDLVSSGAASGSLGTSGVIRTSVAGLSRREVRGEDVEGRSHVNLNLIANRQPGTYASSFDLSSGTNSTIMDILLRAESSCTEFELDLVSL